MATVQHPGQVGDGHEHEHPYQHPHPHPHWTPPPPDPISRFVMKVWARTPRWAAPLAILLCFAGATTYVLAADPTDSQADAVPTCLLKLTTGFDCPGCGGTRAFFYLLYGNIPAAARHHAMFVFALPFLLYAFVAWGGREVFRWRLPMLRFGPKTVGIFIAAWGVFSVLRNLPWPPFTWLYV